MKIQCNACEAAEASVLCCADEAALCAACDEKVHAANKLASKHQRVPLASSSSRMPNCDICQETVGYFFCLEDRALLCRRCDVAIHTANQFVAAHQRFLLTGVKVGLEPTEPIISQPKEKQYPERAITTEETGVSQLRIVSRKGASELRTSQNMEGISSEHNHGGCFPATATSFTSGPSLAGIMPEWPLEDLFGLTDINQNYRFMDQGSSKADNGKNSDTDWSPFYREAVDTGVDIDECLNHAAEISWTVPEVPSPPTASGLHWPKNIHHSHVDHSVYVPDICGPSPTTLDYDHDQTTPNIFKRRRQY